MIAVWILYAIAIGGLCAIGAVALDRACRALRLPTRFIWLLAAVVALVAPLVPRTTTVIPRSEATRDLQWASPGAELQAPRSARDDMAPMISSAQSLTSMIDPWLVYACVGGAIVLMSRLAFSLWQINRRRREWIADVVDGESVLLSDDVGPAVVGLRAPAIVLPRWALALDREERATILAHEREHRRARDPLLLFGGALAVAVAPWNAPLWFIARRLRLAIELDCDARVVAGSIDATRYGQLLLAIAEHRDRIAHMARAGAFAAALTEPTSNLSLRINAMTTPRPRRPRATALVFAACAALVALTGAFVPSAESPLQQVRSAPPPPPQVQQEKPYSKSEVDVAARALSGIGPTKITSAMVDSIDRKKTITATYVVTSQGRVDTTSIRITGVSDPRVIAAIKSQVRTARYSPAEKGGRRVPQTVELPVHFDIVATAARPGMPSPPPKVVWTNESPVAAAPPTLEDLVAERNRKQQEVAELNRRINEMNRSRPSSDSTAASINAVRSVGRRPDSAGPPPTLVPNDVYFDFQVERQVRSSPQNKAPDYPNVLRAANIEGQVVAQFVIDVDGKVMPGTIRTIQSTHDLFSLAVINHLPKMDFTPATVGGHAVRQLVQMPFIFTLSKQED